MKRRDAGEPTSGSGQPVHHEKCKPGRCSWRCPQSCGALLEEGGSCARPPRHSGECAPVRGGEGARSKPLEAFGHRGEEASATTGPGNKPRPQPFRLQLRGHVAFLVHDECMIGRLHDGVILQGPVVVANKVGLRKMRRKGVELTVTIEAAERKKAPQRRRS